MMLSMFKTGFKYNPETQETDGKDGMRVCVVVSSILVSAQNTPVYILKATTRL